jgi:hypothetical protein
VRGVAIVLIALLLGIGGLLTGGAAVKIVREDTCRDANRAAEPQPDAECFAGSLNRRAGVGVLLVGSGLAAVAAMVVGFYAAFTRYREGLFAALAAVSIIFFALAFIAARVG